MDNTLIERAVLEMEIGESLAMEVLAESMTIFEVTLGY